MPLDPEISQFYNLLHSKKKQDKVRDLQETKKKNAKISAGFILVKCK